MHEEIIIPDQWTKQDNQKRRGYAAFKKAGINLLTLPVFHGQKLETGQKEFI